MATRSVRIGTASPGSGHTIKETLAQLSVIARRAASKRIDILLLPEAYLGGYPRGSNFGCIIGHRSAEGRDEYLRCFRDGAVDLGDTVGDGAGAGDAWVRRELAVGNGQQTNGAEKTTTGDGTREELERIAKETGVFLVVGCIERAGGSLYCSVIYVCPKLGAIGKRRKVMPTATERLIWAQGSPATLKAVSTTIRGVRINLAAAICWESYMPLLRQALYSQNINLYLAPTADGRETWLSLMRTIAIEGRCFVLSSNMCTRKAATTREQSVATTTNKPHDHAEISEGETTAALDGSTGGSQQRRNSCLTKEGFEIALPSPATQTEHHESAIEEDEPTADQEESQTDQQVYEETNRTKRRNSCLTKEGFEIALPLSPTQLEPNEVSLDDGPAEEPDQEHVKAPPPAEAKTSPQDSKKRRQSVFDNDGNEIVLCCEKAKSGAGEVVKDEHGNEIVLCCKTSSTATGWKVAQSTKSNGYDAAKHEAEFVSRGGSSIVGPFGDVLAGPQWEDDEGIICADVDFEDCIRGRLDLDAAGSYSRNDSFKFSVQGLDMSPLPY